MDHFHSDLQLLQDVSRDLPAALREDVRAGATALLGAVDLLEGAYAHALADVDLAHHAGRAHVEPVGVVGRQLLRLAGLHHVRPLGQLEAPLALQVLREGLDEFLGLHILTMRERSRESA